MKKARVGSELMLQISEAEFYEFPQDALSRAGQVPIIVKRGDERLAVLVPAGLYDLYRLYEDIYWDSFRTGTKE